MRQNILPTGYGVWLNNDGTWYVFRGYKQHDGRTIRDGLPHRYATRWTAYRAAQRDAAKQTEASGAPPHEDEPPMAFAQPKPYQPDEPMWRKGTWSARQAESDGAY